MIRGLWSLGERGAALEQYHACQRVLAAELGLSPAPELTALSQRIRAEAGAAAPVRPAELLPIELDAPQVALAPQPRHDLPAAPSSFVGRERELAEIATALGAARLVILTGPGGSGKTCLALQAAAAALPAFPDGVWLVELAALHDQGLVPEAVATALGVATAAGQPAGETLGAALRMKRLLLLLDNCEHLARACRELAERLLPLCPQVTILATSRELLRVAGELVWPVPPLELPDSAAGDPEQLIGYASVRLFVERAQAVRPGFALTGQNAAGVAQICRRLDNLPLAIELAAARVRHLAPEAILARLDDRFNLLTAGSQGAARQQTLRAALDWSYGLLSRPEQACFQRLSVFAGSFTLALAEAVAGEPGERRRARSIRSPS